MIRFTVGTEIARSPTEVFAYVTDPAKLKTWQTNTISAVAQDDHPIGLGTRVREVHRAPGGKEFASLVEVSEYEPNPSYASPSSASSPATAPRSNRCSRTLRPRRDHVR